MKKQEIKSCLTPFISITHQLPKSLQVDEVIKLDNQVSQIKETVQQNTTQV